MFEETGLVVAPEDLVGPASTVENAYTWNGVHYLGVHTYFALPLSTEVEVRFERRYHLVPERRLFGGLDLGQIENDG